MIAKYGRVLRTYRQTDNTVQLNHFPYDEQHTTRKIRGFRIRCSFVCNFMWVVRRRHACIPTQFGVFRCAQTNLAQIHINTPRTHAPTERASSSSVRANERLFGIIKSCAVDTAIDEKIYSSWKKIENTCSHTRTQSSIRIDSVCKDGRTKNRKKRLRMSEFTN